ncbi:hypothetical protein TNCV_2435541 [Trichonephila clavipes]|nr:hypothetical protein TNCV_2435541 [Trichonephila clavipes]
MDLAILNDGRVMKMTPKFGRHILKFQTTTLSLDKFNVYQIRYMKGFRGHRLEAPLQLQQYWPRAHYCNLPDTAESLSASRYGAMRWLLMKGPCKLKPVSRERRGLLTFSKLPYHVKRRTLSHDGSSVVLGPELTARWPVLDSNLKATAEKHERK